MCSKRLISVGRKTLQRTIALQSSEPFFFVHVPVNEANWGDKAMRMKIQVIIYLRNWIDDWEKIPGPSIVGIPEVLKLSCGFLSLFGLDRIY